MPAVGIDVSDEAVRFIEFAEKKHGFDVRGYGEKKLPVGAVEGGYINNQPAVTKVLAELKKEFGMRFVVSALPEEKVYLFKTEVPTVVPKEIEENIELKMEENVPVAPSDALFDYDIIKKDEANHTTTVSVSVVPTKVVEVYLDTFHKAGLVPLSFEIEGRALARSVLKRGDKGTYLIVNVAERRTGLFVVQNEVVRFTSTISVGGSTIRDAIQNALNINAEEAEVLKYEKGMVNSKENAEVYNATLNVVNQIKDEVSKVIMYWNTHSEHAIKVQKVLLCGKNSTIKGFDSYISQGIKTHSEIANIWTNIFEFDRVIPRIEMSDSLNLALSAGLTLGVHNKHV